MCAPPPVGVQRVKGGRSSFTVCMHVCVYACACVNAKGPRLSWDRGAAISTWSHERTTCCFADWGGGGEFGRENQKKKRKERKGEMK